MDEFLKDIVDCYNTTLHKDAKNVHEVLDGVDKGKLLLDLEHYQEQLFMLKMVDTWTDEDYKYSDELHKKILATKKELKEKFDYDA